MERALLLELECVRSELRTGRIVAVDEHGRAVIDYPGNFLGPLPARATSAVQPAASAGTQSRDGWIGVEVLLAFDGGDPSKPIVVGVIQDAVVPIAPAALPKEVGPQRPREVIMDGRRLVLEGHEEIVLRCGRGSLTLRADGEVVIRGTRLVSRSSGTNAIKGATVRIN